MSTQSEERQVTISLLSNTLNEWPEWFKQPQEWKQQQITLIERGCHTLTIDICDENGYERRFDSQMFLITYSSLINKIIDNTSPHLNNKDLIHKLITNTINPLELASMTSEQLCPSAHQDIRANIELRKQQKVIKSVSTLYTCAKCNGKRTIIETAQTRALDEGSTKKIECENCQHQWAIY